MNDYIKFFELKSLVETLPACGFARAGELLGEYLDILRERESAKASAQPIPMILHCPSCGLQHIDAPEVDASVHLDGRESRWDNPPHRSHLCHRCGTIWRPADVATVGVEKIQTHGKSDVVMPAPPASARVPDVLSAEDVVEKYPDYWQWETNRLSTFARGWNACRKAMLAALKPEKD